MKLHCLKIVITAIFLFFLTSEIGCKNSTQQKPEGFPELIPCEITIQFNGKPLAGASVVLQPIAGKTSDSWTISGTTNEAGIAQMQTYGNFIGVPEGEYIVLVAKSEVSIAPPNASAEERDRIEHLPAKIIVDPSFNNPKKTKLKITIAGKKTIRETFDVFEKP
jgi:hypothetical protein